MIRWMVAAAVGLSAPALAQEISPCTLENTSIGNLAHPWEENIRSFSEAEVRIAAMNTFEPASSPYHLFVLAPPYDEYRGKCVLVSDDEGRGFFGLDVGAASIKQQSETELVLEMPISRWEWHLKNSAPFDAILQVTVDLETGKVTPVFR